ncbi:hypothetical protein HZC09_04975 [Candidatus Micrarchaeota archaeon]|nr:hypothetical protein [Candidatus Micrarchaeota archaeon]
MKRAAGIPGITKAQATLEALVLFAGIVAFLAAWFAVIAPVQEKAKALAVERLEEAAFERVKSALRFASRMDGNRVREEVYFPVDTEVALGEGLVWRFGNTTWRFDAEGSGARRTLNGKWRAVVENNQGLKLEWQQEA